MQVSIRERDPNYQLHRMTLFQHLLDCYPASRSEIIRQARVDIPPRVRPQVWSAILGVLRCDEWVYRHVDKESPGASDKQIDVDIPRCHQYHNLLGSSEGHVKMRRVLKAWLRAHPHLVYWQGLDSVMIGYFAVFQHLLTFHDPELSVHLTKTDFTPQLYAMPWFLTMFTHVFPLDKTYLIWDKFLVAPRSFPHFFGLAILRQARPMLLSSGFNEHITMFTNGLPSIDIEACIQSAYQLCQITPPSVMKLPPESDNAPMEPAGSTTSLDSWETAPWWNTPISLEARQAEPVPRIFVSDLTRLRGELTLYVDIRDEGTY
ncbi:rab-GTPase-TBC domain-containing protein, partial [Dimargaris cristalligena]